MGRMTQRSVGHSKGRQRAMIPVLVMVLSVLTMTLFAKGIISQAVILRFAITIVAIFMLPMLLMQLSRRCPNCRCRLGLMSRVCPRCGFAI